MPNKFEFKKKLVLDIAGNEFEVDSSSPELIEKVLKFSDEAKQVSIDLGKNGNSVEALKEAITFCCDSIDSVLGDGASKIIFKDRTVSFFEALDVIDYVINEVNQDRDSRLNQYNPNRAQRRKTK